MLNYFNFKPFHGQFLLTNDLGCYAFLEKQDFRSLLEGRLDPHSEVATVLRQKSFLVDGSMQAFVNGNDYRLREAKNYVFNATSLHIFVVTTACNMNCVYCQANNGTLKPTGFMDEETAEKAVDIALESPAKYLSFEFQGGEPLLNFRVIKHIVEYTEQRKMDKLIQYSVVSNLTLLTDEMISFFQKYQVCISTSLDGHALLHDYNRPYRDGTGTYADVLKAISRVKQAGLKVGAIQTTTRKSLHYAREIIDAYCDLGFHSVFLRPLTPLGCAKQLWRQIGYTPQEFTAFYETALQYILQKNQEGYTFQEGHASLLFSKILHGYPVNYMELRSPCGASIGQMAYYVNGDVFTCDEARMIFEMGNDSFRLGNVFTHRYMELMQSTACRTVCISSITESIPSCCDCVYQPYCGVCPVVNLALYNDLLPKTPRNYRCGVYSGILDTLFAIIQKAEKDTMQILESWYA